MWIVSKFSYDRFHGGIYHTNKKFRYIVPAYLYYLAMKLGNTTYIQKV